MDMAWLRKMVAELILRCHARRFIAGWKVRQGADQLSVLLQYLKPFRVVGREKIRFGSDGDGGYVLLNDLDGIERVFSLGIADDATFDLAWAQRGVVVHQFDPVKPESLPVHSRFSFFQKCVEKIEDLDLLPGNRQVLKIDIEGAEWDFFDAASEEQLRSFRQITGEFHRFDYFHKPEWQERALRVLAKLNRTHQLIHIHGNNAADSFFADDIEVPILLELTYVLRSEYEFCETGELFPGAWDCPNAADRADYDLARLVRSERVTSRSA